MKEREEGEKEKSKEKVKWDPKQDYQKTKQTKEHKLGRLVCLDAKAWNATMIAIHIKQKNA